MFLHKAMGDSLQTGNDSDCIFKRPCDVDDEYIQMDFAYSVTAVVSRRSASIWQVLWSILINPVINEIFDDDDSIWTQWEEPSDSGIEYPVDDDSSYFW